ncbi:MAG TPA: aminotransferase class IV [Myxococcota bacterium]|nr:aminotransferase class IV [Myxococcota bacterium]
MFPPPFQNGVPVQEALPLFGEEGLFETMLWQNGRVRAPELHLQRLLAGAARLGLPQSSAWHRELGDFLSLLEEEAAVRLLLLPDGTRQMSATAPPPRRAVELRLCPPLPSPFPRDVKFRARSHWQEAEQNSSAELLFLENGLLLETSRANIYAEEEDSLVTPPADGSILPGVSRHIVMRLALEAGIPLREAPLPLKWGQPLYISSALRGFCAVERLEGRPLSEGPLGRRLRELWARVHPSR